ncbi:hypothetical protein [Leptospira interrogans]
MWRLNKVERPGKLSEYLSLRIGIQESDVLSSWSEILSSPTFQLLSH